MVDRRIIESWDPHECVRWVCWKTIRQKCKQDAISKMIRDDYLPAVFISPIEGGGRPGPQVIC